MIVNDDLSHWIAAFNYGLKKKKDGKWTQLDYLEHMHKTAIEVELPPSDILEFEQEIRQLNKEIKSEF